MKVLEGYRLSALTLQDLPTPAWRNWNTRGALTTLSVRTCGFDSRCRHVAKPFYFSAPFEGFMSALRGWFQYGDLQDGHVRGSGLPCWRGSHSWPQRSQRHPQTVIFTRAIPSSITSEGYSVKEYLPGYCL